MENFGIAMGGKALMQHMPDLGYFAKDRQGRFIAVNPAFAEIAGAGSPERLLGKTDYDIWPHFLADHYLKDDAQVMKTGKPFVNKIELVIRQDRSTEWFATTKVPLPGPEGEA
jgi:PAS domain S-box-containing protein